MILVFVFVYLYKILDVFITGGKNMQTVKISRDLRFKIPREYAGFVKKGCEYVVLQEEDSLVLKRVRRSILDIARDNPDENPPTMDEICDIVHEVRRKMSKGK
jgi:hypothetical protein